MAATDCDIEKQQTLTDDASINATLTDRTLSDKTLTGETLAAATTHTSKIKTDRHSVELWPQPSDDPRDPLNWSRGKKLAIYGLMVYGTFAGIASGVANVLATSVQAETWNVTPEQSSYSVSAALAGIIVGPVLLVPLVRVFGVMSCCFWSEVLVVVTSIWSASSNGPNDYGSFIASRAVGGMFSATCQVFSAGVIAQLFFLHQRGKAFAVYSTCYMVATFAGPSFSGFVVQYVEWPVVFWWTVAANGLAAVLFFCFGEDTTWDRELNQPMSNKPAPNGWFARRLWLFLPGTGTVPKNKGQSIKTSINVLGRIGVSPITVLAGIFSMISFGWCIMAGVQTPITLQNPVEMGGYGFDPQSTAFFYFTCWIGAILGVVYGVLLNDRLPQYLKKRNGGAWHPEYRLQTCWLPGLIIGPVGQGIYGAAVYYHTHWIVMAIGQCMLVFGATASIQPSVNYVIEVFKSHAQECATALNVWRLILSITVQFFYSSWVQRVGVNWVWGTAAFINIFAFSLILLMILFGPELRSRSFLTDEAAFEKKATWSDRRGTMAEGVKGGS